MTYVIVWVTKEGNIGHEITITPDSTIKFMEAISDMEEIRNLKVIVVD